LALARDIGPFGPTGNGLYLREDQRAPG
jgi:hypothetical protein